MRPQRACWEVCPQNTETPTVNPWVGINTRWQEVCVLSHGAVVLDLFVPYRDKSRLFLHDFEHPQRRTEGLAQAVFPLPGVSLVTYRGAARTGWPTLSRLRID